MAFIVLIFLFLYLIYSHTDRQTHGVNITNDENTTHSTLLPWGMS